MHRNHFFKMKRLHDNVVVAFPRVQRVVRAPVDERAGLDWQVNPTIIPSTTAASLDSLGLSNELVEACMHHGMDAFFAVQTAVIPRILHPSGDVYVHAPTGSGKTLAYVLPIVQALSTRRIVRLRALVVVPTRDLAIQVRQVFDTFTKGTVVKVAGLYGQNTFKEEQSMLVDDEGDVGGSSRVDVLVCTPGRLVDHLQQTRRFTLQHVKYLVVDEVDRLVSQSFQEWLPFTVEALERCHQSVQTVGGGVDGVAGRLIPTTDLSLRRPDRVQKLLLSATLTNDVEQLAHLSLYKMQCISIRDGDSAITVPSTLTESIVTMEASDKPLHVLHLMLTKQLSAVLCFCKSVDSAQRLCRLIRSFFDLGRLSSTFTVEDLTGQMDMAQRKNILKRFKQGDIQLLVCSDLVARGIDLDNVNAVIVYDMPNNVNTYVHRIGRCARAGKVGQSWVLVENEEARAFKDMMRAANRWELIKRVKVKPGELEYLQAVYQDALDVLERVYHPTKRS
jgi:ATP-dependent RNA helicase DDX51/DBP6